MTTTPQKRTAATPTDATPTDATPTAATLTAALAKSTKPRTPTRRARKPRNGTPISITSRADGGRVVSWYPSGVVGDGKRMQSTCVDQRAAMVKAAGLEPVLTAAAVTTRDRIALDAADPRGLRGCSFEKMIAELFDLMIDRDIPEGSLRAYESNVRTWIPATVMAVPCRDLQLHHYTAIFDAMARGGASKPVVRNVGRTLGRLIKMGSKRQYLDATSFGSRADRAEVLSDAKRDAPYPKKQQNKTVLRDECPSIEDVERFADAADLAYPGYGARLIKLLFASGLRMCEALALQVNDVNIEKSLISVTKQLNRYKPWPEYSDPKNGHHRKTLMWPYYADVLNSLVTDAVGRKVDPGYLFPRTTEQKNWPAAVDKLLESAIGVCGWEWTPHWLRHSYATTSLGSQESGGYGMKLELVSFHLGHQTVKTTLDYYLNPQANDLEMASRMSAGRPGVLS